MLASLKYYCPRVHQLAFFCSLSPRHRIIAEGGIPPTQYEFEREKWAMGERFGRYGQRGGVDIRQLWPSVEEIEEINALRMYRTAKEAEQISKTNVEKEQIRRKNRLDRIERNWQTHDEQLAEFHQRAIQSEIDKESSEQELERKVEEVKNFFGYWVDPNDPRFAVMLQHKEQSAKLEAKMASKKTKKYGQVKTVSNLTSNTTTDKTKTKKSAAKLSSAANE
uniref:Large ribosomal subunit protein mL64 n=1 Tax=Globodera rostochiensis TaxID=31243 RepID=A0A914H2Q4_GLORO